MRLFVCLLGCLFVCLLAWLFVCLIDCFLLLFFVVVFVRLFVCKCCFSFVFLSLCASKFDTVDVKFADLPNKNL